MIASRLTKTPRAMAEDAWEAHKSAIYDLYVSESKRLRGNGGLIEEMQRLFGFIAT
jgi:hypothetical protein